MYMFILKCLYMYFSSEKKNNLECYIFLLIKEVTNFLVLNQLQTNRLNFYFTVCV